MKRVADELERDSKRPKLDSSVDSTAIFKDAEHEKNATELLEWTDEAPGYIVGTIRMKWPLPKKLPILLEMFSSKAGRKTVRVEFPGRCAQALQSAGLQFKVGQELCLSLKGVELVPKTQGSSTDNTLPISLKYDDGVALEIRPQGQEPGRKIDTWFKPRLVEPQLEEPSEPASAEDEWFLTPKESRPPPFVIPRGNGDLMDIDEEPSPVAPSPSPAVSKPSIAPSRISERPLNNIGNQQPPNLNPASRPVHTTAPTPTNAIHAPGPSAPKENPGHPNRKASLTDPSSNPPLKAARPPNVTDNHASTSKHVDRKPAAEAVQPPNRGPPFESEAASHRPSAQTHSVSTTKQPTEDPEPVLNKKQRKNKAKKEKKKAKAALPSVPATATTADPASTESRSDPRSTVPTNPVLPTIARNANPRSTEPRSDPRSTVPTNPVLPIIARNVPSNPVLPTIAAPISHPQPSSRLNPTTTKAESSSVASDPRLEIPRGFSPLSEVAAITSKWAPRSVIGIVTSITSVSPTTKGDLTRSLRIVDPSNCIESDFSDSQSFRVNCFMKKYEQWLPAAKVGDVVILRTIKTTGNGSANGYSDSFKWAVYDSAKGQVGHGDLAGAPESEGLANGFGAMFTPFYQATDADSAYCLALDDWWRSVKEKREGEMGTVHQIGSGSSSRPKKRQHMLASDFSESETAEYFDCTVEVLAGYQNDYSTFSLYVTDYTTLQGGRTQQQNWCPPSLADSVLKIEMWDAARELGPQMFAGDFYWLKNVRMVTDRDGYREAKLVESKTLKLEPADADTYPHFKALIQRKKAFGSVDKIEDSPMKLIVQAKHREYFTCVVEIELLHVEDGKPVIYVTDYTSHSNMSAINKSWTAGLETRVLKVLLSDNQANFIQHLTVGDIYRISHLRLQVSGAGVQGTLGGSERLIHPINPRSSSLEEWKTNLVERKNDLKRKTGRLPSNVPPEVEVSPPENRHDYVSIKQLLLSTKCPGTFFVRARITDFFPFRLNDSFVRTCTHCKQVLSMERLSCFHCNDVEHNYVEIVSFLRVLINDGDDELKLSICGNVPLLDGLEPVILRDDPEAARRFSERIKPLLNNLVEVHDGILEKRMVKPAGPVMTLIVDSWKGEEGEIVYGLTDYER